VLVVDDDVDIAGGLELALSREGYDVAAVGGGEAALAAVGSGEVDVMVLDLGLPDLDGIEVCRRMRAAGSQVPAIVLSARHEELDAVAGLDAGADDYVTKPFRLAELLARVRAQLRRVDGTDIAEANGVRVDIGARRAWVGDRELELRPKEFDLLALLVRHAGQVLTRERIMAEVWDEHWYGSTKTLDMHVSWLRRKLGDDPNEPRLLTTVRGVGLRFEKG
jgi:DNA-binding response OmpR family regulator